MNKFIKSLLFTLALTPCTLHAQSLKDLFLKMPQEVCPILSEYNRLELVDNQKNGKPMQTRNLLQGYSSMKVLTDDYASLTLSKTSEKTLKLLPQADGTSVILMISTVFCDSIADSSLSFYSTDWKPLLATDFISQPTSTEFRRISLEPETNQLTIVTSYPLALQTNGSDHLVTLPSVTSTFRWDGKKFQSN